MLVQVASWHVCSFRMQDKTCFLRCVDDAKKGSDINILTLYGHAKRGEADYDVRLEKREEFLREVTRRATKASTPVVRSTKRMCSFAVVDAADFSCCCCCCCCCCCLLLFLVLWFFYLGATATLVTVVAVFVVAFRSTGALTCRHTHTHSAHRERATHAPHRAPKAVCVKVCAYVCVH